MKLALVYGGSGALGRAIVTKFRSESFRVISVDFKANDEASENILLDQSSFKSTGTALSESLKRMLNQDKLDAILTVAGGWAGGNLLDKNLYDNVELMTSQSVQSSVIAACLAAQFLKEGGLLTLTGASAASTGTPGMIAYGMAKAAVHQLVKSVAGPESGFPAGARCVGILPVTLDTPMNRKWMPKADTSSWTPLETIATYIDVNLGNFTIGQVSIVKLLLGLCTALSRLTVLPNSFPLSSILPFNRV